MGTFQNNDVSVTKVTITDKDCAEIAALGRNLPDATHILRQFHVLKAVDTFIRNRRRIYAKHSSKSASKDFYAALYAKTQGELDAAQAYLAMVS